MGFEIGSQNAVSIQNVDGDLSIREQHIEASWSAAELRRELATLEDEVARIPLPNTSRVAVEGALAAAATEAAGLAPDKGKIGKLVERATHVLDDAGALTAAGAGFADSLRRTATALGPAGKAVIALLALL
jgi:hypothetical protein